MKQATLFCDETSIPGLLALAPEIPGSRRKLSATQRRFNTLLERIDKLRAEREQWQTFAHTHIQRITTELAPRAARLREQQMALARLLDRQFTHPALGKRNRGLLRELLVGLLTELLEEEETAELVALYDRHAGASRAEEQRVGFELLRTLAEDLPIDVDAYEGEATPEAFSEWLDRELGGREPPPRQRSAKARGREPEATDTPESGTSALRAVFRRLASTLHPDREADPQEQRRKTVLMQELNAAYAADDLLRVLELQQTVDSRAADALAGLSDAELRPYISLLERQAKRLRGEIDALIAPFAAAFPGRTLTPTGLRRDFEQALAEIEHVQRSVTADLERFADVHRLREALEESRHAEAVERCSRGQARRRRR